MIDAKTGAVAATIPLPGKPEFSVADGKGKVYVNIEDTSEIVEIDAAKATVTKKYALTGATGPSGLAFDAKNRRLFSVCGNRVMAVSDPDAGKVVATPAIGAGSDGAAFDPGTGLRVQLERRRHADDRAADGRQMGRAREHRHRARRAHDRARREDAQGVRADRDGRPGRGRRPRAVSSRFVQGAGGRQVKTVLAAAVMLAGAIAAGAQEVRRYPRRRCSRIPRRRWRAAGDDHAPGRAAARQAERNTVPGDRGRRGRRARGSRAGQGRPAAGVQRDDAVPRQPGDAGQRQPQWPLRLDGRRQHVPRLGGHAPGPVSRRLHAHAAAQGRGGGSHGGRQARDRAARPRRHGHEELLRAGGRPAQVRHGAAGGAAGRALPGKRAAGRNNSGRSREATSSRRRSSTTAAAGLQGGDAGAWTTRAWRWRCCCFPRSTRTSRSSTICRPPRRCRRSATSERWRSAAIPICDWPARRCERRGRTSGPRRTPSCRASWSTRCYGIEANEFALHSRIAAQPELGVLPNLGYFVTVNLTVPIWDWGGLRSKLHQSETRERQAQTTLSQTQRQLVSNLYSKYNETLIATNVDRQPAPHRGPGLREPAPARAALSGRRIDDPRSRRRARTRSSRRATRLTMPRRGIAWRWRTCKPSRGRSDHAQGRIIGVHAGGRAAARAAGGKKEEEAAPVVTVDVAPVLQSQIQRTIRADGLLYPRQQAAIVPKVSAPVKKLLRAARRPRARRASSWWSSKTAISPALRPRAARRCDLAEATFETTAKATVPQELQKAELDARAAKDAFDAAQAVFDNRQRLYQGRRDRAEGRQRRAGQPEPGAQPVRDLAKASRGSAEFRPRSGDQGGGSAARCRQGPQRRRGRAAGVLAHLEPDRRRRHRSAALSRRNGAERRAGRHGHGPVAGDRARPCFAIGRGGARGRQRGEPHRPRRRADRGKVTHISPALDAASTTVEVWVRGGQHGRKAAAGHEPPRRDDREDGAERAGHSAERRADEHGGLHVRHRHRQRQQAAPAQDRDRHSRQRASVQVTDGLESGQRVATTGAFELFKLDPEVLEKTKVQIAPAKEEEEPEES